jgi:uncharacterized protein
LNIAFLAVFALLYYLHRNRERFGGGQGYARDVVCGMQVETAHAPAHTNHHGTTYWFCSDRCRERFDADPDRYARGGHDHDHDHHHETMEDDMALDPVCGMQVDPATAAAIRSHDGRNYFFCNPGCAEAFEREPAKYLDDAAPKEQHHHH